ncbi:uncharacterized protein LOC111700793 [Eurytemora carolleeae]|uniref:uncharacterized protein LOC111700793 n=1 Tax=Eurytemora carolleeae TaxID=1294199 RepID=UPI000C767F97|nr:uncharacterized protein LOC111700793 [Eurytemora carolleeae]|eukprot:XP_023327605.1 uncharacterized protein LOC111700793 [Eurytemora affinis]
MSEYEYTYIVDLDEYIMPRYTTAARNKTDVLVSRALESINSGQGKNVDNFLFRNTFFCSEFNKKVDYENNFDIFKILSRQKSIWSPRLRAKMLVRTMTAIAVGHHSIFEFVDPVNSCNYPVPHQIAMLNHYRSCLDLNSGFMGLGEPVLSDDVEYDDTALVHQYSINKSPISIFIRQHIQDSVSP